MKFYPFALAQIQMTALTNNFAMKINNALTVSATAATVLTTNSAPSVMTDSVARTLPMAIPVTTVLRFVVKGLEKIVFAGAYNHNYV